ncbi:MAG: hypothetical protein H5T49_02895 [Hadesarchaea archaeon]|nr:hypothetical protein [Hadesarchaea archaeon]
MKVKILKPFRMAGKEYHPPNEVEIDDEIGRRLIAQKLAEEIVEAPKAEVLEETINSEFESVGDISEVLSSSAGGEGEEFDIDALVGVPIVITDVVFGRGRSGRLEGKDNATVQIKRQDGSRGWFLTWSGPMIAQLKQLVELNALPRKCKIEERHSSGGNRYYILASTKTPAR